MAKIIWTEPALNDLQEIIDYIAKDSFVYAERLGFKIVQAPKRLKEFPYSGRVGPEFYDDTIRELIYGSYRIMYKISVDEKICYIVAVIHGSRDILKHLKPGEWNIQ